MTQPYRRKEQIGDATLYLGDCLHVLRKIDGLGGVITDPPYSSGGMVRGDRMGKTSAKYQTTGVWQKHAEFSGDNRDQRSFAYWVALWLSEALMATKPSGVCCLFSDWRQLPSITDAIQAGGWVWRGIAVWDKVNARPFRGRFRSQSEYVVWGTNGAHNPDPKTSEYPHGVFQIPAPAASERQHATQKPTELMEKVMQIVPKGEVVCDPFMGSGTTGVAAINTGRPFIGIELSEHYFDIARERIAAAYAQGRLFS